jgi:copper chaperone CopZ
MPLLIRCVFFLTFVSTGFCADEGVHHADGTKAAQKEGHRVRIVYYLTGLESPAEAQLITEKVKGLKSVTAVTVNTERHYALVIFDSHQLSYHQVAQAMVEAGTPLKKAYDPRVVVSIPDYASPANKNRIDAVFADEKLKPWIAIEPIDAAKGLFFVHFRPLLIDPNKTGTQGFNGGYLTHPIHMAPPVGMALPFKYLSEDNPAVPTS